MAVRPPSPLYTPLVGRVRDRLVALLAPMRGAGNAGSVSPLGRLPARLLAALGVIAVAWVGAVTFAVLTFTEPGSSADPTPAAAASTSSAMTELSAPLAGSTTPPAESTSAAIARLEAEVERLERDRVALTRSVLALETTLAAQEARLGALSPTADPTDAIVTLDLRASQAAHAADVEAAGLAATSERLGGATTAAADETAANAAGDSRSGGTGSSNGREPVRAPAATSAPPVTAATMHTGGRDLYNCRNFTDWAQAQAVYEANLPGDPNRIDTDGDGIACESLRR